MIKKDEMLLVEKHIIRHNNLYFEMLKNYIHLSKNLFNYTLYAWRQAFFKGEDMSYEKLYKYAKNGIDYSSMPTAQSAQQTIKRMHEACKAFKTLNDNYKENLSKHSGKPQLPRYLKKDGFYTLTLTNQNCKLRDNYITFPKVFDDFKFKTKCFKHKGFVSLQQIRIHLKGCSYQRIIIEVVFKVKKKENEKLEKTKYCGIDLGVENFATLAFNFKSSPILIKGAPIKSINQYFNKKIAFYSSRAKKCQNIFPTKRIEKLWEKRKHKIDDFFHKVSKKIVEHCIKNNIGVIIVGKNKGWKKYKKHMQNFVYIPYNKFIEMLRYKAKLYGIEIHVISEKYTSGTSFLDNELPIKTYYNKKRRVFRGMFVSNSKQYINADVNAALQIIRKYVSLYKSTTDNKMLFDNKVQWFNVVNDVRKITA